MPTPEEKKQTDEPLDMLLADAATELRAIDCESLALAVEEARNRLAAPQAPESGRRFIAIEDAAREVAECKDDGNDGPCGACLEQLDTALGIGQ